MPRLELDSNEVASPDEVRAGACSGLDDGIARKATDTDAKAFGERLTARQEIHERLAAEPAGSGSA